MNLLRVFCSAAVALCLVSVSAAQCEHATASVTDAKSSLKAQQDSIDSITNDLTSSKEKFEKLGFKTTLGDLKTWQDIGDQERARAIDHAISGWIAFTVGAGFQAINDLDLPRIKFPNRSISHLKRLGIKDKELFEFIRRFYGTSTKEAQKEAWTQVVSRLGALASTKQLRPKAGGGQDWEYIGEAAATVLSFGLDHPLPNTLAADVEFMDSLVHSLAYQILVDPRLEDFNRLSEEQLHAWSALNKLLVSQVKQLKQAQVALKDARTKLSAANRTLNICSSCKLDCDSYRRSCAGMPQGGIMWSSAGCDQMGCCTTRD